MTKMTFTVIAMPDDTSQELTNEELEQISGGNFTVKDLADRLKVPTTQRRKFYTKIMDKNLHRSWDLNCW